MYKYIMTSPFCDVVLISQFWTANKGSTNKSITTKQENRESSIFY